MLLQQGNIFTYHSMFLAVTSTGVAPYDIVLIKLPYAVQVNDYVNVACLPSATDSFPPGTPATVAGWGKTHYTASEYRINADLLLQIVFLVNHFLIC